MKSTAGPIKTAARKRRPSRTSRHPRVSGLTPATAAKARGCYIVAASREGVALAEIALERLTKVYGDGTRAVSVLELEIADGEFIVLVGPSGCGKTTALRMVAGLEEVTDGTIRIGDRIVNRLPPKQRDIAMVFQNYALYPHMSAFKNMAFGLKLRKMQKPEIRRRVGEAARVLGLMEILAKRPRTLSGGQRQRVAMGRAIVREPRAFLMDEPLSNLFVAEFIGSPAMNLVGADLERKNGGWVARFGDHELEVGEEVLRARPALPDFAGRRLILGIRPEDLEDARVAGGAPEGRSISAVVDIREDMGSEILAHFGVGAPPVRGEDVEAAVGAEALEATAAQAKEKGSLFVARLDRSSRAREGDPVELAVTTSRLHFFDPNTGLAIYDAREDGAASG